MKVKNLNPIERHVEKVVLAVAVAAAAYLGWQGMEPTRIGPGKEVGPGDVERQISVAIDKVKEGGAKTEELIKSKRLSVEVKNYQADYQSKADAGLPVEFTQSNFRFLPMQAAGTTTDRPVDPKKIRQFAIELPVPDPINVHTMAGRGRVSMPVAGAEAPPPAGSVAVKATVDQDATVVRISGNYPLQELRDKIANIRDPSPWHRLDAGLQFVSIYRLEVQRQERNPDGTWPTEETSWKAVTGLKNVKPLDPIPFDKLPRPQLKDAVALINAAAGTILEPPMYDTGERGFFPALPEVPGAATATAPVAAPRGAPPVSGPPYGYGGGGGAPSGPSFLPPGMVMGPNGPIYIGPGGTRGMPPNMTGVPTPTVTPAPDAARVLSEAKPGVWAYDEDVKPEHEYQYRMRVAVVNPLFKYERPADLKLPDAVKDPLLYSSWVAAPEKVFIKPSSYFFVMTNGSLGTQGKDLVDIQIYKFSLGVWYMAWQKDVRSGTFIGDAVQQTTATAKGVDYSTGYTVVDIIPSGADATVVLLSPGGQLVTRNVREDREKQRELQGEIDAETKKAAPTTLPANPATLPRPPVPGPTRGGPGYVPPGPPRGPGMRGVPPG